MGATTTAAAGGGSSSGSGAAATSSGTGAVAAAPSVTMGSIPIGITTTPETTSALPTTYVAGASAPVNGAPALPAGESFFFSVCLSISPHPTRACRVWAYIGSWPVYPFRGRKEMAE
jgi:hypothetical protein